MEECGEIDLESSMQKICVSWFAIHVCCVGTKLAVQAWNEHTIPGILTDNWSAEGLIHKYWIYPLTWNILNPIQPFKTVWAQKLPIRIYMGGLIVGINTLYMLFCFFNIKLFALV